MNCKNCGGLIPNKTFLTSKGKKCLGCDDEYHRRQMKNKKGINPKSLIYKIQFMFNSMRRKSGWEKEFVKKLEEILR